MPEEMLTTQCPREIHVVIPAHPETTPLHKPRVAHSLQSSWPSETSQLRSTQARQREQGIYFHQTTTDLMDMVDVLLGTKQCS